MKKIIINQLRRISRLEFELPEAYGRVFLLTGANGAGKSTLISTLAQIGDPEALNKFFQPNIFFNGMENVLSESSITFETDDTSAEFRFDNDTGQWRAVTGDTKKVFGSFGYPETLFAGAKPKRQSVPGEVFETADIRSAPEEICRAAAGIFDDENFMKLSLIRSPVTGEDVYIRPLELNGKLYYFSENNFSAGERAVIKLAAQLRKIARRSLVLIDEAEMALHPKAQKRLMLYLEDVARKKELQVIVSTQSASIIKISDPRRLLFLEDDERAGEMVCRRNVYPAAILGEMAFEEEILPEAILLVEDPEAQMLLEAIVAKLKQLMADTDFPYTKILPVGGYMQVIILMDNLSRVFPNFVHRRAVLDKDAENNVRRTASDPGRSLHTIVSRNIEQIYFLPCAPEQGVIRLLEADPKKHSSGLRKIFGTDTIHLNDVMRGNGSYRSIPGDSRSDCKDKLTLVVRYLASVSSEPEFLVRKKLYRYYVDQHYTDAYQLKKEYCPLFFRGM